VYDDLGDIVFQNSYDRDTHMRHARRLRELRRHHDDGFITPAEQWLAYLEGRVVSPTPRPSYPDITEETVAQEVPVREELEGQTDYQDAVDVDDDPIEFTEAIEDPDSDDDDGMSVASTATHLSEPNVESDGHEPQSDPEIAPSVIIDSLNAEVLRLTRALEAQGRELAALKAQGPRASRAD
jgi:hypothetical protein